MFEFTNEQRKCFGLPPLADFWDRVTVKPSPYDDFSTIAYLDGNRVQRVLMICEHGSKIQYQEMQIDAVLSADRKMLLPKTGKGKPKLFSSSNLLKRGAVGMYFCYVNGYISIKNQTSAQTYYHSAYEDVNLARQHRRTGTPGNLGIFRGQKNPSEIPGGRFLPVSDQQEPVWLRETPHRF